MRPWPPRWANRRGMDPAPGRYAAAAGLGADRQGRVLPRLHALCARLPRSCAARRWRRSPRPVRDAAGLGRGPAAGPLRRLRPALGRGARALARRRGCRRRAAGRLSTRPSSPTRATATSRRDPARVACRPIWPPACCRPASCARQAANLGELDSGKAGIATWINELLWREVLPAPAGRLSRTVDAPAHEAGNRPCRGATRRRPARLAEGRTGIPIVDAAMRQLLALGWMHNRLRMVTAMFLSRTC